MRANEFVIEAFDQPYPLVWEKSEYDAYDAYTKLDDGSNLSISFELESAGPTGEDEAWHVSFWRNYSLELTGEGDAQRIFATVLTAIQKFIRKENPERVTFNASKQVGAGQNSQSRARLYDRMVQRYASSWGYQVHRKDAGEVVTYDLVRKDTVNEISRDRLERYLSRAGRQVDTRQERMARARQRLNTSYEIYHADQPTKIVDRFEADTPADAQRYYQDYIERYESDVDYDLRLRRGTGIMESTSNKVSVADMIAYLKTHHDPNLHQDYTDYIENTFDHFVLKNVPTNSIPSELPKLDREKVERYRQMDFSKAPPIVIGDRYILDGYHRLNAAKVLGIPSIRAYVGVKKVAEGYARKLNFDEIYGKYLKVTDNNGDPNRPGFSLVTPLNGASWNWRERPEFIPLVKKKLNQPGWLGNHKYQQIIDAMAGREFDPKRHIAEFATSPERDNNDDVPDPIFVLANRWWNAAEKQPQIESVLTSMGWSIQQVESEDDAVQLQHRDGTSYFISADDFDPDVFENATFNTPRRRLNVPELIKRGAIFITHPHGDNGWETKQPTWDFSLITLQNVLEKSPPWSVEYKKYLRPESYREAIGSQQFWAGLGDDKYKQILWSIKKLGIPDEVAFLDTVKENFADGKVRGKSRPGRVKRAGASCSGSVSSLRAKAKKYGGEKGKMYHWCANMKAGKKK